MLILPCPEDLERYGWINLIFAENQGLFIPATIINHLDESIDPDEFAVSLLQTINSFEHLPETNEYLAISHCGASLILEHLEPGEFGTLRANCLFNIRTGGGETPTRNKFSKNPKKIIFTKQTKRSVFLKNFFQIFAGV